jgi:hypothetical protein
MYFYFVIRPVGGEPQVAVVKVLFCVTFEMKQTKKIQHRAYGVEQQMASL